MKAFSQAAQTIRRVVGYGANPVPSFEGTEETSNESQADDLYERAIRFVREKEDNADPDKIAADLGVDYSQALRILHQMEDDQIVSAAGSDGKRKVLAYPQDEVPPPIEENLYANVKIENFHELSRILAKNFPGHPPLEKNIEPMPIGFKQVQDGLLIESSKFNEKIKITKNKVETELERDKTLSAEAAYLMAGLAVAQGMKSVCVNGKDDEKFLLALAANTLGIKISNREEIGKLMNQNPQGWKTAQEKWSKQMSSLHPDEHPQPVRPGPAARPAPPA
jgi:hypothetical protein